VLRLKQRDRRCPSQSFTGPQVAQEWNTTQLLHVRWSGFTAGGTSKRGRVQNSPSGRVEGMEAKRTRGARLRRGIPPKNKELNGRQRKVTTTNKPSPACASTTPSKLLPCSRYTPTAGDVEKEMFAARRARKWVKETWRAEQGAVQRKIRGRAPPRCEVHPTNHRQRLGVELTRDPYAEKGVYFLRENY